MRVAVTGGRDVVLTEAERRAFSDTLEHIQAGSWGRLRVCHGDCRGVDQQCSAIAREAGYLIAPYPANWEKHGKAAGPIRNREMLKRADHLIAFRGGRGTESAIQIALELGIEVTEIGR